MSGPTTFAVALPWVRFADSESRDKVSNEIEPVSSCLELLQDYDRNNSQEPNTKIRTDPASAKSETKARKLQLHLETQKQSLAKYDPYKDPKVQGDAQCTVFLSRLNYSTDEDKLREALKKFGSVVSVRLVTDLQGQSRGYAFVVFESANEARKAVVGMNGKTIDGFKIVCDVERGRLVKNWKPRRLGGGVGKGRTHQAPTLAAQQQHRSSANAKYAGAATGVRGYGTRGYGGNDKYRHGASSHGYRR